MSDFRAKILAELDSSQIPSQLKEISNQNTFVIRNIRLEKGGLFAQIQAALDESKFSINIGDNKDGNIKKQGANIGKQFCESVKDEISKGSKSFISSLKIGNLSSEISVWEKKNPKAQKKYKENLDVLNNRLSVLDNRDKDGFEDILNSFKRIKLEAKELGILGDSFFGQFSKAFKSITKYLGTSTIISLVIDATKRMVKNVIDINSAMTELKKVTNVTDYTYKRFLDNAGNKAKALGTTIKDLVSSTADFSRLGYSMNESEYLAEVANIYAVVGDNIKSIDEASQSIVSTIAAFKVDVNDAMSIVDKFNAVSNNFAISSGGIGEALQRSASSLAAANNTLSQSIALITSANTVVQDEDIVGTAMKTISLRIRQAKTELEENGLNVEYMAESTAELRDIMLSVAGIDILESDESTFRSTYDILDDLAKKWEELDEVEQASLEKLIAGTRQGNVFNALMTNFDVARKALTTSETSDGSAVSEHEKWLESLEAKINQFRASLEGLSMSILKDNFLGGLIDSATILINALTFLNDTFGTLGITIAGISFVSIIKNFD